MYGHFKEIFRGHNFFHVFGRIFLAFFPPAGALFENSQTCSLKSAMWGRTILETIFPMFFDVFGRFPAIGFPKSTIRKWFSTRLCTSATYAYLENCPKLELGVLHGRHTLTINANGCNKQDQGVNLPLPHSCC